MKREKTFAGVRFPVGTLREARQKLMESAPEPKISFCTYKLYEDNDASTTYDDEEEFFGAYGTTSHNGYYSITRDRYELVVYFRTQETAVAVQLASNEEVQTILEIFENEYVLQRSNQLAISDSAPPASESKIVIEKAFHMSGFVLSELALDRICSAAFQLVASDRKQPSTKLVFNIENGQQRTFDSLKHSLSDINKEHLLVSSVSLAFHYENSNAVAVTFSQHGMVNVTAIGSSPIFAYEFENLARAIEACREDYGWGVQTFIYKQQGRKILGILALSLAVLLLFSMASYIVFKSTGVPFDDKLLLSSSDEFYHKLEHAMRSTSQQEKLDVLLLSMIKDLRPSSGILRILRNAMSAFSIMLLIDWLFIILLKTLEKCYQLSYFLFDWNSKTMEQIKRKRDRLENGIIIGFAVNVLAGLFMLWVSR